MVDAAREKPACRRPDDPGGGEKEQGGFDQCRNAFDLGVTIMMLIIGGLIAPADGEIGDDGGAKINEAVDGLGQDAERAGENAGRKLRRRQPGAGGHGDEGDVLFLGAGHDGCVVFGPPLLKPFVNRIWYGSLRACGAHMKGAGIHRSNHARRIFNA